MISLRCDCGYEEERLFIGCGIIDKPSVVLGHCQSCRRLVAAHEAPALHCPTCRGAITNVLLSTTGRDCDEDGDDIGLPEDDCDPVGFQIDFSVPLRCSRCGKLSLEMKSEGLWD
jgi:hypothetical protein